MAKFAQFGDAMDQIQKKATSAAAQMDRVFGAVKNTISTLGLTASVGGFVALVKHVANVQDELNKLSQRVGVSVEALSGLKYAGDLADVSLESLGTALKKLATGMAETQANTGEARDAFHALGINVESSKGVLKSSEQIFNEVADAFAGIEDGAGKTALAVKIFGRAGSDLIPLLNQGRRGLKEAADEAKRFGVLIGQDAAKAAEEFNDNLTRMSRLADGFKIALGNSVIGPTNDWIVANLKAVEIAGSAKEALRLFVLNLDAMTTEKPREEINRLTEALQRFQSASSIGKFMQSPTGFLFGGREEDLKKQLEFTRFLERQQALAGAAALGGDTPGERARLAANIPPLAKAPALPDRAAIEKAKKQAEELQKLFDEVSRQARAIDVLVPFPKNLPFEKAKEQLEQIRKSVTEGTKDWIAHADAVFADAEAQDQALAAGESFQETMEKLRERVSGIVDPTYEAKKAFEQLDLAVSTGWLTQADANFAKLDERIRALLQPTENLFESIQKAWEQGLLTNEQMQTAFTRAQEGMDRLSDKSQDFAHVISSAFEDAAVQGKKFQDVLKGLAVDLAKIFYRLTVTKPLENAVTNMLGGGDGLGGIWNRILGNTGIGGPTAGGTAALAAASPNSGFLEGLLLGSFQTGTDYVPQTGPYLLHQGEQVVPAGESSSGAVQLVQNIRVDSRSDILSVRHAMAVSGQRTIAAMEDQRRRTVNKR